MTRARVLLVLAVVVGVTIGVIATKASAQIELVQRPENFRFRAVASEPIATADGKNVVNGWQVVVFRNTKSDQCYVAFISGGAMSMTGPGACP